MAIKEEAKTTVKKNVHFQWTSSQEEVDKMIDLLVDSVCNVCAVNITKKIEEIKAGH